MKHIKKELQWFKFVFRTSSLVGYICLIFVLTGCKRGQVRAFLASLDKSLQRNSKKRKNSSGQNRKRNSTRDQRCTSKARNLVHEVLSRKRVYGIRVTRKIARKRSRNSSRERLLIALRDERKDTYQLNVYKFAVVEGSCSSGWRMERFVISTPYERRQKRLQEIMRENTVRAWRVRLTTGIAKPLKSNGRCWDMYCSRKMRNKFAGLIRDHIKNRLEDAALNKVSALLGVSMIKAKIVLEVAKLFMRAHVEPDLYAEIYLAKKQYFIHRNGHSAKIMYRIREVRKLTRTYKAKNRIVAHWNEKINIRANRHYLLVVKVWDKDLRRDDYVGQAYIPLSRMLEQGKKHCVRGSSQLHSVCFFINHN